MRLPRDALVAAVALPAATLLPYLYGVQRSTPGRVFTWIHSLNPRDTYTYLAWIEQARRGQVLFQDLLTMEAGRPLLFHPLFLLLGLVARVTGVSNMAVFQASRLVLGAVLILLLDRVVRRFVADRSAARATLLYLLVSGGIGWAFLRPGMILTAGPPDLWMPESSVFLSLLESPLFLCSWCLVAGITLAAIPPAEGGRARPWLAGALALVLGFVHPYEVVSVAAALGVAIVLGAILRWPRPAGLPVILFAILAGGVLPAAYQVLVLARDPIFGYYTREAFTPSPSPVRFALAYFPSLVLGGTALGHLLGRRRPRDLLLLAWPIATAILIYTPTAVQRRFVLGVQIPLAILAGIGAFEVLGPAIRRRAQASGFRARLPGPIAAALLAAVLAASALSNIAVVRADIEAYRGGKYPQYLPAEFLRIVDRFDDLAPDDAVLLADLSLAYFVPAHSGRHVFAGHYDLTVDLATKIEALRGFYDSGTPDDARREFLARTPITHVLHSPVELDLGSLDPASLPYLEEVAADGPVRLFRVRREMLPMAADAGRARF